MKFNFKELSAILLFSISFCIDFYSISVSKPYAQKVFIEIESHNSELLNNIDVYHKTNSKLISNFDIKSVVERTLKIEKKWSDEYFSNLVIRIRKKNIEYIEVVRVVIGNSEFSYPKVKFLNRWKLVNENKEFILMQAPSSLSVKRSIFPYLNNYINWDNDIKLIYKLFVSNLLISLLYWFFISYVNFSFFVPKVIDYINKRETKITLLLALLIGIYRLYFSVVNLGDDGDSSWMLGLSWATINHLKWGKDIIFTFGPLHWILYPNIILSKNLLITSFILNILISILSLYFVLKYTMKVWGADSSKLIFLCLCLFILVVGNYTFLDLIVCSISLILINNINTLNKRELFIAGFLLAITSHIKVSYIAYGSLVGLIFYLIILYKNRNSLGIIFIISFLANLFIVWIFAGQIFFDFIPYLKGSYEIGIGYSESMSYAYSIYPLLVVAILFLLYIVFLTFNNFKDISYMSVILITTPIVLLSFKEGFVRDDMIHIERFYSQIILILLIYFIEFQKHSNKKGVILFCIFCVIGLFPIYKFHKKSYNLKLLLDTEYRNKIVEEEKLRLRKSFNLDNATLGYIKNSHDADVLPLDISLLYAYGINWRPRPVIQTYSAYTDYLDNLNASFYKSQNAPNYLLISNKTIDSRNLFQENPRTMRQIKAYYNIIKNGSSNYLLLKKDTKNSFPKPKIQRLDLRNLNKKYSLNIPDDNCYSLFGKIEKSFLGKMIGLFFKLPPLYLNIEYENGDVQSFRLIRENLNYGIPLIVLPNSIDSYRCYFNDNDRIFRNKKIRTVSIKGNLNLFNIY